MKNSFRSVAAIAAMLLAAAPLDCVASSNATDKTKPPRAASFDENADKILTRMHQAAALLTSLQASIVQETLDTQLGPPPNRYQGRLFFAHSAKKGDRIRITYVDSRDQVTQDILIDGETICIYEPRAHQEIITTRRARASQNPEFDFLTAQYRSVSALKARYNAAYVGDGSVGGLAVSTVTLTPKAPSSFTSITISIDHTSQIPVQYRLTQQGKINTFTLGNVAKNPSLDGKSVFKLTVPKGTDLIRR